MAATSPALTPQRQRERESLPLHAHRDAHAAADAERGEAFLGVALAAISCSSVTRTRAPEAPIGWPSAIAPPLTLTLPVSQPRSLLTAQACAANASLASTRSRSLDLPAGLLERGARRRDRARAHDRRIDAGVRPRHDARKRDLAALGRIARGHQHHRGRAVVDAGGIAGGHGAVLGETPDAAWSSRRASRRGADIRQCRRPRRPCAS